jgi:hypothetical protein
MRITTKQLKAIGDYIQGDSAVAVVIDVEESGARLGASKVAELRFTYHGKEHLVDGRGQIRVKEWTVVNE